MHADLDALVTALYVRVDDLLPKRQGPGCPPRITDAELIALAVAQMFLGVPNDRKFLAFARWRLGHLFTYLPKQPGYNKRLRALAPRIAEVLMHLSIQSPSFCDNLRLLDSTPVPCGQSRETARRSELAGHAGYGWCRSHSRYFWGFRLYLLCAPDGMPIAFELAAANVPERIVAAEMLARVKLEHYTVIADKGFAGEQFEQIMAGLGARFLRPDRKDEPRRHGPLGAVRQWIESVFWTCKGQLTLEHHGGRTIQGLCTRVALRLLALAAGLVHNQHIGDPGRHFA
ncbi:MAG: IS982 family transposase, partial [Actinobacteria bacterium]|nr:IS982 family transposase [Actinomycetota bacterium]